jgi:hypothetical protein
MDDSSGSAVVKHPDEPILWSDLFPQLTEEWQQHYKKLETVYKGIENDDYN